MKQIYHIYLVNGVDFDKKANKTKIMQNCEYSNEGFNTIKPYDMECEKKNA